MTKSAIIMRIQRDAQAILDLFSGDQPTNPAYKFNTAKRAEMILTWLDELDSADKEEDEPLLPCQKALLRSAHHEDIDNGRQWSYVCRIADVHVVVPARLSGIIDSTGSCRSACKKHCKYLREENN